MNPEPMLPRIPIIYISILCILFFACSKNKAPKNAVAQVGNSVLTVDQLHSSFPVEYKHLIKKEQYLDYIKRWMDEEILYQHALDKKIDIIPDLAEKIKGLKKKIVVEHYLDLEFSDVNFKPQEAAVQQYYESHPDDFLRTEPEVRLLQLKVGGDRLAWEIHNKIKRNNFWGLIHEYSTGPKPESLKDVPFKKKQELLPCIADPAFNMRVGGTSIPIKCDDGVRIIRVAERKKSGTLKILSSVKDEIHTILVQKWQQRNLHEKIDDLKKEIYFSSNLDLVP